MFTIQRERCKESRATPARVAVEVKRLKPQGPSSFAVLRISRDDYYQVAGGGGGMMVEKRVDGRQFRGFQQEPVVPFDDGTVLRVGGGRIPLRRDEWFSLAQVIELLGRIVEGAGEPGWILWRDLTGVASRGVTPRRASGRSD